MFFSQGSRLVKHFALVGLIRPHTIRWTIFPHGRGVLLCLRTILLVLVFCSFSVCPVAAATTASGAAGLRGKVNTGGPENWPEAQGLSNARPVQGAASLPAPQIPVGQQPFSATQSVPPPGSEEQHTVAGKQVPAPVLRKQSSDGGQPNSAPLPLEENAAKFPANADNSNPAAGYPPQPEMPATPVQAAPTVISGSSASGTVSSKVEGLPVQVEEKTEDTTEAATPRQVIYVDEQGNPVPKPPEPDKMLAEAERLMDEGKFSEALPQLEQIRALPNIPREMREKVLYHISDCLWARYADNPLAGYESIDSSTKEALNANLRSPRVPDALLRLGLANCNVGNLTEGEAYMKALLRRHPDYPGVAQGFTALGKEQLRQGREPEAEQSFSLVLDKFPEASELQAASVGLATALYRQNDHDKARVILDFINKRWPRYYIEDPTFLLMQADNAEALENIGPALDNYWLYVNLEPRRDGNDVLLLKMGDIYSRHGNMSAANFIYTEVDRRFPGSQAAITARLRMAEQGIYESPLDYETMRTVFARESDPPLWQTYCDLAASSQTIPDAVLARLKQAMWLYWDKQYTEAMGLAADFIDAYPEHPDASAARNIIWDSFEKEMKNALAEENYGRILILWNGFPFVRERYGEIDPDMRYALARGWLERGDNRKGFELLGGFLQGPKHPRYGEAAFSEFFNCYLKAGAWQQILELAKLVEAWDLSVDLRKQLDYAMALSAQNLNLAGPALSMWKMLADRTDIPLYQRAYATYFLARDAENRKDIRNAYRLNRQVIELFGQLQDERSDKADPQRIKEAIAALMDICEVGNRVPEALEWLKRYNTYVQENSPEYPGLRFREARLHRKLGDSSRAQALLENIVSQYGASPFAQAAAGELATFEVSRDLQAYMPGGDARQSRVRQPQLPGSRAGVPVNATTPGGQRAINNNAPTEQEGAGAPGASNSTWSWQQPNQQSGEPSAQPTGQPAGQQASQ